LRRRSGVSGAPPPPTATEGRAKKQLLNWRIIGIRHLWCFPMISQLCLCMGLELGEVLHLGEPRPGQGGELRVRSRGCPPNSPGATEVRCALESAVLRHVYPRFRKHRFGRHDSFQGLASMMWSNNEELHRHRERLSAFSHSEASVNKLDVLPYSTPTS